MQILLCNLRISTQSAVAVASSWPPWRPNSPIGVMTSRCSPRGPLACLPTASKTACGWCECRSFFGAISLLPISRPWRRICRWAFLKGMKLGRKKAFDIINTHFAVPTGPLGDWLSRRLEVPNVLSVWGQICSIPPSRHRRIGLHFCARPFTICSSRADAVVAQSRDTQHNVSRIYGVQRPAGVWSPAGDCAAADSGSRASVDVGQGSPRERVRDDDSGAAGFRARLRRNSFPVAGHSPGRQPTMYLVVVGEGPDSERNICSCGQLSSAWPIE